MSNLLVIMAARKILDILVENISISYSNRQCVKKIGIIYPGVNYDSLKIKTIFIFSSLFFFLFDKCGIFTNVL